MYSRLARYYDLIYAKKDYRAEAAELMRVIGRYQRSEGRELLEVACGTGRYLERFEERYRCTGLDLNRPMLRIARRRLERSRLVAGDMLSFDLGVQFDVVACLFSSIGYIHGPRNLRKTVRNLAAHLKPGGVLLISPWVSREDFVVGRPDLDTYQDDDVKIARAVVSGLKGENVSRVRFHWLIAERNRPVRHIDDDVHELAMHSRQDFLDAMRAAGLAPKLMRGTVRANGSLRLYVGVKPVTGA